MAVSGSLSPILLSLNARMGKKKVSDQDYNCYNRPSAGLRTLWTQFRTLLRIENPPRRHQTSAAHLEIAYCLRVPLAPSPSPPTPPLQPPLFVSLPLSFPAALDTLCGVLSSRSGHPLTLSIIVSSPRISIHDAVHAYQGETSPTSQNFVRCSQSLTV